MHKNASNQSPNLVFGSNQLSIFSKIFENYSCIDLKELPRYINPIQNQGHDINECVNDGDCKYERFESKPGAEGVLEHIPEIFCSWIFACVGNSHHLKHFITLRAILAPHP